MNDPGQLGSALRSKERSVAVAVYRHQLAVVGEQIRQARRVPFIGADRVLLDQRTEHHVRRNFVVPHTEAP
jgi:hypothetical protein